MPPLKDEQSGVDLDNTPRGIAQALGQLSRRDFIKLSGSTGALAILAGCRNRMPAQFILPYLEKAAASGAVLGEARRYASTFPMSGFTQGILVTSHEGRPTKIEGHPLHPASRGATHVFAQAALMDLYSPHRLQTPCLDGNARTWIKFGDAYKAAPGNVAFLTQEIVSPTLARQLQNQSHFVYQSVPTSTAAQVDYEKAERVLSVDCDFLFSEPGAVENARAWKSPGRKGSRRLYCLEPTVSLTGTQADHRWALRNSEIQFALTQIETQLEHPEAPTTAWQKLAEDLRRFRGRSAVVAGFSQSEAVHDQVARINQLLGNPGQTVFYSAAPQARGLEELVAAIESGAVGKLIILGGNPVFEAPADVKLTAAIQHLKFTAHLTLFENETSATTHWALPASHFLESWSDATSFSGDTSLIQPLLTPLYASRSSHELVALVQGEEINAYDFVRSTWAKLSDELWRNALQGGFLARQRNKQSSWSQRKTGPPGSKGPQLPPSSLELEFRPDPTIWDGQFAENPWLQELPKVQAQTTWDNALWIAPATATTYKLNKGDLVRISTDAGQLETAVWIVDGLPDGVLTLHLGYGRTRSGPVAEGAGFDAQKLRSRQSPWRAPIRHLEKIAGHFEIACTQEHHTMDGRDLLRTLTQQELENGDAREKELGLGIGLGIGLGDGRATENIHAAAVYNENEQWAMTIDLDSCIGCSSCVVACQIENNIPAVGKKLVLQGRAMHWIRIDRYRPTTTDSRHEPLAERNLAHALPVTCMHCESAPCELVCPVQATAHSSDGLNQMVYNRCVGTRYCSNNCPYKVRRFNFLILHPAPGKNCKWREIPTSTVRSRGVMENAPTACSGSRRRASRLDAKIEKFVTGKS